MNHATSARFLGNPIYVCSNFPRNFEAHTNILFIAKSKRIFLVDRSCIRPPPPNYVDFLLTLEWLTNYRIKHHINFLLEHWKQTTAKYHQFALTYTPYYHPLLVLLALSKNHQ